MSEYKLPKCYGAVSVFDADTVLHVYTPYEFVAFRQYLNKTLSAKWNSRRKCWEVPKRNLNETMGKLEKALECLAPQGWLQFLARCEGLVNCLTTSFDMILGTGGAKVKLPNDHPIRWKFKQAFNVKYSGTSGADLLLLPTDAKLPLFQRAVKEIIALDFEKANGALDVYANRLITGTCVIDADLWEKYGLKHESTTFVTPTFLKYVDPFVKPGSLKMWPLHVSLLMPNKEGYNLTLQYLEAEVALRELAQLNAKHKARTLLLRPEHAHGEWAIGLDKYILP
ncbi:hypothetical protein [Flexibacterium corallicola]|uniref:hypothetical protein n=1 Tax=Flexibacterium corallicola TaxID=3037259 RepID=UPI00286F5D72|nr:hypothetical protein [Pseudovibrio sp. M1P-2-3]